MKTLLAAAVLAAGFAVPVWAEGLRCGNEKDRPLMYGELNWTQVDLLTVHGAQGHAYE